MSIRYYSFSLPDFDPLKLYLNLCPTGPGFLESLNPLPKTGHYSIIPLHWCEYYRLENRILSRSNRDDGTTILPGKPLVTLARILRERAAPITAKTPFPCGFFGYFGYDLATHIEDLPQNTDRDLPSPALELYWVDTTAVYDHKTQQLVLATSDPSVILPDIEAKVKESQKQQHSEPLETIKLPEPNLSQDQFISMVKRGKEYIAAGDVYQINLSCRFEGEIEGASTELYRQLRQINPAPFLCFLHFPDIDIISSSPERLVSLRDGLAETRPIAGTRPRGYSPVTDQSLGEELLAHPKERAEHIMLLDLERNDLGKVCRAGSVEVDELMVLERYSHVTHIVSNVRGKLNSDYGPFELLTAIFPGGTITGVPKKRCMEIIDELEPVGRSSYTGSAGYISACGTMDLNILIRSFLRSGKRLTYQTGAGIVADSIPEREWEECLHKGKALHALLHRLKG